MIIYDTSQINAIINDTIQHARCITVNHKKYIRICAGYDTETTRINKHSYVYHFGITMNKSTFGFRTWDDFINCINHINTQMHARFRRAKQKPILLVWVANLSFEFQFLKDRFSWDRVFATKPRQPLSCCVQYVEFREALKISGSNLAHLARTFCKTQKMVGDLDYAKIRNTTTPLTSKELQYIENDTVILSEFADYIFKHCGEYGCIPYTSTGILRQECKNEIKTDKAYKQQIKKAYFDESDYKTYMKYLYRGGFTHANRMYVNTVLYDVESWDKKSSYPASMLQEYYPVEKFISCNGFQERFTDEYCCILDVYFFDIKNTTTHSIESSHKIIDEMGAKWDNGRLMSAQMIHVLLTEIDYKIYKKFYRWKSQKVISCKIAKRGKLPEFLRRLVLKYFVLKENTPKDTTDYHICKTKINSFYGMSCTHIHFLESIYKDHIWQLDAARKKDGTPKEWADLVKNEFLLPAWGIWITAHSRACLLNRVYDLWQWVIYCDTDSIYLAAGYDKSKILERNAELNKINLAGEQCNFPHLGCYEYEGRYKRFKTLGSKKYVKEYYIKDQPRKIYHIISKRKAARQLIHKSYYAALHLTTQTIAGLEKNALSEYCNKTHKDIFDVFTPDMTVSDMWSQKLITHYEDAPHMDNVGGEIMTELSSVSLCPSDFKVHINRDWLNMILTMGGRKNGH